MTAAEIAEVLAMALSTVSAILKRIGLGKRSRLGPLEPANRYECARPASCSISTRRSSRVSPGQATACSVADLAASTTAPATSTSTSASMTTLASPMPSSTPTSGPTPRSPSSHTRSPSTKPADLSPHRQRQRLHLPRLARRLQHARPTPHPHPPQTPANQRKSRTLHPNTHQRMGLRVFGSFGFSVGLRASGAGAGVA